MQSRKHPMSNQALAKTVQDALAERFGERLAVDESLPGLDELARIAGHRTHRRYLDRWVPPER